MNNDSFLQMHLTGRDYWWYRAKEELLRLLLERFAPADPAQIDPHDPPLILDLGCGTGTMFGFLAEHGLVTGLEPSSAAARFAATRKTATLVRAAAGDLPFPDQSFDKVAMFDCLEHIEQDDCAVREAVRVVRPGGVVMVTVPAFSWLSSWRETQLGHKRRYSRTMLVRLLESAGLKLEFISYMYAALFPVLVLKSLKDKLIRPPEVMKSDIVMLPEPWNSLMAGWFIGEARLCNRFGLPFGTSLVCFARPGRLPSPAGPAAGAARVESGTGKAHNTSP